MKSFIFTLFLLLSLNVFATYANYKIHCVEKENPPTDVSFDLLYDPYTEKLYMNSINYVEGWDQSWMFWLETFSPTGTFPFEFSKHYMNKRSFTTPTTEHNSEYARSYGSIVIDFGQSIDELIAGVAIENPGFFNGPNLGYRSLKRFSSSTIRISCKASL